MRRMSYRTLVGALSLLALSFFLISPLHAKTVTTTADVVVIGDVHGAYDELTAMLKKLEIVDAQLNWAAGSKHFVSVGDLVDRGPGSRQVIELMMRLQSQAEQAGGAVHVLLGNHEVMLMTGDYRYVTDAEYSSYADMETPEMRDWLWARYQEHQSVLEQESSKADFIKQYPLGFMGLTHAFSEEGKIGRWLRNNTYSILKLNDTLFVHAGYPAKLLNQSLDEINQDASAFLADYSNAMHGLIKRGLNPFTTNTYAGLDALADLIKANRPKPGETWVRFTQKLFELQESSLFDPLGPFWYRGSVQCPELSESYDLEAVLKHFDARQAVVGHTVKYKRTASRMDGLLYLVDTGMLKAYYRGEASALTFSGSKIVPFNMGSKPDAPVIVDRSRFLGNPQGWNDKKVETFLQTAKVVDSKFIGTGITKPKALTLEKDGIRLKASFKYMDNSKGLQSKEKVGASVSRSDRYQYEVAAYKLDRMIGMYLVPPVVIREVDGKTGAVQLWVEDTQTENQRKTRKGVYYGPCSPESLYRNRYMFDILIYNDDRNNGNILWDKQGFLYLIDHSQSFRLSDGVPKIYKRVKLRISQYTAQKLQSLTKDNLSQLLSDYLHPQQIDAILMRRDNILNTREP